MSKKFDIFFVLILRHANLFVGRGSESKKVDLSTPCLVLFARSPTASEGKDERSDVNPSLSYLLPDSTKCERGLYPLLH